MSVAKRFAAEGYAVAMIARQREKLNSYAAKLRRPGCQAHGFEADAGNEPSLRAAFRAIEDGLGATDVLLYNAFAWRTGWPTTLTAEALAEDFRVNVVGALVSVQQIVEAMKARGRGTILITGGGLALNPVPDIISPSPGFTSLAIGKAGLRSLAFSLAKELEPVGIHVATVTICGEVREGTHFAPDRIADVFYHLHAQPTGKWDREVVYDQSTSLENLKSVGEPDPLRATVKRG